MKRGGSSASCVKLEKGTCGYARSIRCPQPSPSPSKSVDLQAINAKLDTIMHMLSERPITAALPMKPQKDYAQWANDMGDALMQKYAKDPQKANAEFVRIEKELKKKTPLPTSKAKQQSSRSKPKPRRITPVLVKPIAA